MKVVEKMPQVPNEAHHPAGSIQPKRGDSTDSIAARCLLWNTRCWSCDACGTSIISAASRASAFCARVRERLNGGWADRPPAYSAVARRPVLSRRARGGDSFSRLFL